MEFLVHIEIVWPPEAPEERREEVFSRELLQGQALAHAGQLRRLWRIPGRWANWSLYDVTDATELHAALSSLPLYPWMDVEVHALAAHPNDPRALGIGPEAAYDRNRAATVAPADQEDTRMRLLAITPIVVSDAELERRQRRYDALAPDGVTVVLEHLGDGPHALETEQDIRDSEDALLARYRAIDPTDWDGFLPDCVLDPVSGLDHGLPLPVYGLGRLAAAFVTGQGARLGAVARNEAIAHELDRKLAEYAVPTERPTTILDLSVEDIADDATWAAAVEARVADLDCDFVLNACSAVEVAEQPRAPYLLDPTRTALALLAVRSAATGRTAGAAR